jgi:hypothetical protein
MHRNHGCRKIRDSRLLPELSKPIAVRGNFCSEYATILDSV